MNNGDISWYYERRLFFIICFIGIIRSSVAIIIDLYIQQPSFLLLQDAAFLFLFFTSALGAYYTTRFRIFSLILSIGMFLLTALSWLSTKGVDGSSGFTMITVLVSVIMINGKKNRVLITLLILSAIALLFAFQLILPEQYHRIAVINPGSRLIDFIMTSAILFIMIYYLKGNVEREWTALTKVTTELIQQQQVLGKQTEELRLEEQNLIASKAVLEALVEKRKEALHARMKVLEGYAHLNSRSVESPLQAIQNSIRRLSETSGASPLVPMLKKTSDELSKVIAQVQNSFADDTNAR